MDAKPRIGWIGLGKMGTPMATNLLSAGYSITVCDVVDDCVKAMAELGATAASSPKELASTVDVAISMIPDDKILKTVSIGPDGVLNGMKSGGIYIDMSTVSPKASAEVAKTANEKGISYLRSPVSGSTALATSAKLTIFVSGDKAAYQTCDPVFLSMGQKSFHVGDGEQARYLKLVINIMVGLTAAITAEALSFGEKGDMDWEQMIDIINNSVVASPLLNYKAEALKQRDFTPAFTAMQLQKDFGIVKDTGTDLGLEMPLISLVQEYLDAMKAGNKGDLDFFGLLAVWEEMANIKTS